MLLNLKAAVGLDHELLDLSKKAYGGKDATQGGHSLDVKALQVGANYGGHSQELGDEAAGWILIQFMALNVQAL